MGRSKARISKKKAGSPPPNYSSKTSASHLRCKLLYRKKNHIGKPLLRHHAKRTDSKSQLALDLGLPSDTVFIFRHSIQDRPDLVGRETLKIEFGTVAVIDKRDFSVILIVRCIPFERMNPEIKEQFNNSFSNTYLHARARNKCTIHSSLQVSGNEEVISGWMGCCGWRGGCEKGKSYGPYSLHYFTSANVDRIKSDKERMVLFHVIRDFWAGRFSTLSLRIFKNNLELPKKARVPGFDELNWQYTPNGTVFASNLIVTCDGFSNLPHTDNDHTRYVMGMWGLVLRKDGKLYDKENDTKLGNSQGASFRMDDFGVEVNFDACNGCHELIWDTKVPHHTTPSKSYNSQGREISHDVCEVTQYGSSCQISESLVNRIKLFLEKEEEMGETQWQEHCKTRVKSYEDESSIKLSKVIEKQAQRTGR